MEPEEKIVLSTYRAAMYMWLGQITSSQQPELGPFIWCTLRILVVPIWSRVFDAYLKTSYRHSEQDRLKTQGVRFSGVWGREHVEFCDLGCTSSCTTWKRRRGDWLSVANVEREDSEEFWICNTWVWHHAGSGWNGHQPLSYHKYMIPGSLAW